jgi:hypothetical protein
MMPLWAGETPPFLFLHLTPHIMETFLKICRLYKAHRPTLRYYCVRKKLERIEWDKNKTID